jgi:serine protease AprX
MGNPMKYALLAICLFLWNAVSFAQNPQYAFRVHFSDKNPTAFTLSSPSDYLSQRALDRRAKYSIAIDSTDLPVIPGYVDSVLELTGGVLHLTSRWQNSCVILLEDSAQILQLQGQAFIKNIRQVAYYSTGLHEKPSDADTSLTGNKPTDFDAGFYGAAWSQIHLCNGEYLHEMGKMGEGMLIAVIDIGFTGVNTASAFDSMFANNRLADTWNYIYDTSYVFSYGAHGCQVLSCMASYLPETHVGTAPKAMYALYTTDDGNSEHAIEEDNLVAAIERADSIGADLISTSLGYNEFTNPADSYTYDDLDGNTTLSAKAANAATRKGIMLVVTAGNEGNNSWQHILTPGDADSVMTVGSVDPAKSPASSSGEGPNAAGVLKPNVCAQGITAAVITSIGTVASLSGTSFATPVMAGLTACLMQSAPQMHPMEIRSLIESVSHVFSAPNNKLGNGVPDFMQAYNQVTDIDDVTLAGKEKGFGIYPNPATKEIFIYSKNDQSPRGTSLSIYDIQGKRVAHQDIHFDASGKARAAIAQLTEGLYFLHIRSAKGVQVEKLVKAP